MAQLPPPRLPGQPPDRPPIRRPGEHLPLPNQLGPAGPDRATTGVRRKRVIVAIGLLAVAALLGAGAVFVLGGDDENLDTAAAAQTIDDAVAESENTSEPDCPIDDPADILAVAIDPLGEDMLYDVVDLGVPMNSFIESDEGDPALICGIVDPEAPGDLGVEGVGLGLTVAPDDFVEYSEQRAADQEAQTDVEQLGDFRGGAVYHQVVTSESENFVDISWVNDDIVISVLIGGDDIGQFDADDMERGLTEILPAVVAELAGEDAGD